MRTLKTNLPFPTLCQRPYPVAFGKDYKTLFPTDLLTVLVPALPPPPPRQICPAVHSQVRLNGEDPAKDFQPCPGILGEVKFPTHLDGVRVDSWVESGTEISPYYDSLLGKLMVHAPTREMAVAKIQEALAGVWRGMQGRAKVQAAGHSPVERGLYGAARGGEGAGALHFLARLPVKKG